MTQRPRVLLLIPHLGGGGAERVTSLLAENLCGSTRELHLGLITQTTPSRSFLPCSVQVHGLGARRVRAAIFPLLHLVWKLRPDVILSGMAHLNFLVLLLRPLFPSKTRILIRQNGTVSSALTSRQLPFYTRLLYRLLYRHADWVICQSHSMAQDLRKQTGTPRTKLAVLLNPVDVDSIRRVASSAQSQWSGPGPHLLAVGRLSSEKGFEMLLHALAALKLRYPGADLTILGAGPQEAALRAQCEAMRIDAAVRLPGHVEDPAAYFPGASVFVLSSQHEGLPNALLEAAAAGLPLIALPASGGIVNLIGDNPGEWLAREVSASALTESLTAALESLHPLDRFPHAWIEQFRLQPTIQAYEALINLSLREKHP
jgi:glycosyltransferase involved in cell wall biosynthesis